MANFLLYYRDYLYFMWEDFLMKRKYGLRSIIFFISICVSVFAACFCVLLMAGEYYTARNKLDVYTNEYQGWEACRQTEPTYFKSNVEAVSSCINNLEEAKENFWIKLSKAELIMLFAAVGLGSAIGGYLTVWIVWFTSIGIHRFVRWIKLFFESRSFTHRRKKKDHDVTEEIEEPELYIEKPIEGKEGLREGELVQQVETLRDEVCSVRSNIERLSAIEEDKFNSPKDEFAI
jgi:hypothetical protein